MVDEIPIINLGKLPNLNHVVNLIIDHLAKSSYRKLCCHHKQCLSWIWATNKILLSWRDVLKTENGLGQPTLIPFPSSKKSIINIQFCERNDSSWSNIDGHEHPQNLSGQSLKLFFPVSPLPEFGPKNVVPQTLRFSDLFFLKSILKVPANPVCGSLVCWVLAIEWGPRTLLENPSSRWDTWKGMDEQWMSYLIDALLYRRCIM